VRRTEESFAKLYIESRFFNALCGMYTVTLKELKAVLKVSEGSPEDECTDRTKWSI
jgi:hypothetical protein